METISNILNKHLYPYERRIINIEGLAVINSIDGHLSRILPKRGNEIVNQVSRPVRMEHLCMLYCYGGTISCRLNMIEYTLRRYDIIFFRENSIVEIFVDDPSVSIVGVITGEGYLPVEVGMKDYLVFHEQMSQTPLVHLSRQSAKAFVDTCRLLEEVMERQRDTFTTSFAKAYMQLLYLHCASALYTNSKAIPQNKPPRQMVVLKEFFDLVEHFFNMRRDISFYADKLCLAPKYASQVICRASGKKPGEWIRDRVVLEAKILLLDGHHNVQQVANALGFPTQSAFGKYFKQATGLSPREYCQSR